MPYFKGIRILEILIYYLLFIMLVNSAACASVKNTTKRTWVRLVSMRYGLQLWKPDEHVAASLLSTERIFYSSTNNKGK
jgi:hypothetical protein